jgi:hypothetical protein
VGQGNVAIVYQIQGDLVELLFDPRQEPFQIGTNLVLRERGQSTGLVVQLIELRTPPDPALMRLFEPERLAHASAQDAAEVADAFAAYQHYRIGRAKIRRTVADDGTWSAWDGSIVGRDVEIAPVQLAELDRQVLAGGTPTMVLGQLLQTVPNAAQPDPNKTQPFQFPLRSLGKVSVITGAMGSGKSHLAKNVLIQLVRAGASIVVLDLNGEYGQLDQVSVPRPDGQPARILHLRAGREMRLGIRQFGLRPLFAMISRYGLPDVSKLVFENRMSELFEELQERAATGQPVPFIGIAELKHLCDDGAFYSGAEGSEAERSARAVNAAIRQRLDSLDKTRLFARTPDEAISLTALYDSVVGGGALIFNISELTPLARLSFIEAALDLIRGICEAEIGSGREAFPYLFLEEAHLYVSRENINALVTRTRHLGLSCLFVTNFAPALEDLVLRQTTTLFLLPLNYREDIHYLTRSALIDSESLHSFALRLPPRHCLTVGTVTAGYPLMFAVDRLAGIPTAGQTRESHLPGDPTVRSREQATPADPVHPHWTIAPSGPAM